MTRFTLLFLSMIWIGCATAPQLPPEAADHPELFVFEGVTKGDSSRGPAASAANANLLAEFSRVRTVLQLDALIRKVTYQNGPTEFFESLPQEQRLAAAELMFLHAFRGLRPRLEWAAREYRFKTDELLEAITGFEMDAFNRVPVARSYLDGIGLPRTQPFRSPERFRERLADLYVSLHTITKILEGLPEDKYGSLLCSFGCLAGGVTHRSRGVSRLAEINSRIAFVLSFKLDGLFEIIRLTKGKILHSEPLSRDDVFRINPRSNFMTLVTSQVSNTWIRSAHQRLRQAVAYQENYERALVGEQPLNPFSEKKFEIQNGVLRERKAVPVNANFAPAVELITFYMHPPADLKKWLPTKFTPRGGYPTEWNARELNIMFPELRQDSEAQRHINAFMLYWPGGAPFPLGSFLKTRPR